MSRPHFTSLTLTALPPPRSQAFPTSFSSSSSSSLGCRPFHSSGAPASSPSPLQSNLPSPSSSSPHATQDTPTKARTMKRNAVTTFKDVIIAQQKNDLQRIEAEQMMRAEKAYMEGKEREVEALQTAVKNAAAKRDTAKATYDRLRAENAVQSDKNKAKREGMLHVANIVDVTNKENDRSLEQHNKEMDDLHTQLLAHIDAAREQARFLCRSLKLDPDDPRVVEKGEILVKVVEGEEGREDRMEEGEEGGKETMLVLPAVGVEEVGRVEGQVKELEVELAGMTGTLETLCREVRQAQEQRARAEEEVVSLAKTVEEEREGLAKLQEEVEKKRKVWRGLRIAQGGGGGGGSGGGEGREGGKEGWGEEMKEGGEEGSAE